MGSVALSEGIAGVPFSAGVYSPASTAITMSRLSNGVKVELPKHSATAFLGRTLTTLQLLFLQNLNRL